MESKVRVLVTGATGFVGGHVVRRLANAGYQVLATGRNVVKGELLPVPFRAASLDVPNQALAICEGQDVVVHCAAFSSPWGTEAEFRRHNETATENLLAAGVKRFVHISSAGVYFRRDERLQVKESDPLPVHNGHPYLDSKRRAEILVQQSQGWVILRPRAVYGPGDTAIFPRILRLLRPGFLPILGSGENLASLTYVGNLALAVQLALSGETEQVYNVTDGEPVLLWPLLQEVAARLQLPPLRWRIPKSVAVFLTAGLEQFCSVFLPRKEPPLTQYTLSLLTNSQTLCVEKIRRELGYEPLLGTQEGVWRTLESLC